MLNAATTQVAHRVLFARMDNLGDVLLTSPAVRSLAARADVVYLCSPRGRPAAITLPGVTKVITGRLPWIDAKPLPVTRTGIESLVQAISDCDVGEAIISTSFHQNPLPLALVMRIAGVGRLSAISVDYAGSLLDVRHNVSDDIHEVERGLSLTQAAGYPLPHTDGRKLRVCLDRTSPHDFGLPKRYVVLHPGASVSARAWPERRSAALVQLLTGRGHHVVLTGTHDDRPACIRLADAATSPSSVTNLVGLTDFPTLATVIKRSQVIVCGNTGPAHIAAAVETPVVSIYAPTVPDSRWRPWMVPHVLLGRQDIACAGCRARVCPVPGHPCINDVRPETVAVAVESLMEHGKSRVTDEASRSHRPTEQFVLAGAAERVRPR